VRAYAHRGRRVNPGDEVPALASIIIRTVILALAIAGLFVLPDPWRIIVLVCAVFIEVGEVFFWIRFLRRYRVTTGVEGLIGSRALVIAPPVPAAPMRVRVRGEIWNARSREAVEEGDPVRIEDVDGLTLVVGPDRSPN
jgi:membrane protein implicated in regulation of membrane protease activity